MTFPTPSLRVSRGKHVVGKKLLSLYNKSDYAQLRSADANTRAIANQLPEKLIPPLAKSPLGGKERKHFSVCIIGGGCAGLYAAKLLADLEKKSFDHLVTFDIDILEASERVGGRAYTHHFPKDDNCKHNYYDMGAMRIPDIASMKP